PVTAAVLARGSSIEGSTDAQARLDGCCRLRQVDAGRSPGLGAGLLDDRRRRLPPEGEPGKDAQRDRAQRRRSRTLVGALGAADGIAAGQSSSDLFRAEAPLSRWSALVRAGAALR